MSIPALTQIKTRLVDPTAALLAAATGGLVSYEDLYAANGGAEGGDAATRATIIHAAGYLEGYFWQQVTSVSGGGESVSWATGRAEFYGRLARGEGLGLPGEVTEPPAVTVPFAFATIAGRRGR